MAERKSYGEKLRDPRWQRRRLEIWAVASFGPVEVDRLISDAVSLAIQKAS